MVVDGKAIAAAIEAEVTKAVEAGERLHLTAFTCAPNFETQKYLSIKQAAAKRMGVVLEVVEFDNEAPLEEMVLAISTAPRNTNGIVVQLPFPKRINTSELILAVPPSHDVDVLTYDGTDDVVLPPVVAAIKEISDAYQVSWQGKRVVVIGQGRLVGAPAALWAKQQGAAVEVIAAGAERQQEKLRQADIIISGAGVPGLLTSDLITSETILFDAGTSESMGVLCGDVAPEAADVAALITPVPGGIGPITIAALFKNLLLLSRRQ